MRRRAFLALPALLAACSSPAVSFYTLAPRPGQPGRGGPKTIEIRRIGLPGYLDRPEIVRNSSAYRLDIPDAERWGEPLSQMMSRVLAEDLMQRMPGSAVVTASGAISALPDATVEIDLQRFDADASNQVVLLAQTSVRVEAQRAQRTSQTVRLAVQPQGESTTSLVAAMSDALAQLSDRVATMLQAASRQAAQASASPPAAKPGRRRKAQARRRS